MAKVILFALIAFLFVLVIYGVIILLTRIFTGIRRKSQARLQAKKLAISKTNQLSKIIEYIRHKIDKAIKDLQGLQNKIKTDESKVLTDMLDAIIAQSTNLYSQYKLLEGFNFEDKSLTIESYQNHASALDNLLTEGTTIVNNLDSLLDSIGLKKKAVAEARKLLTGAVKALNQLEGLTSDMQQKGYRVEFLAQLYPRAKTLLDESGQLIKSLQYDLSVRKTTQALDILKDVKSMAERLLKDQKDAETTLGNFKAKIEVLWGLIPENERLFIQIQDSFEISAWVNLTESLPAAKLILIGCAQKIPNYDSMASMQNQQWAELLVQIKASGDELAKAEENILSIEKLQAKLYGLYIDLGKRIKEVEKHFELAWKFVLEHVYTMDNNLIIQLQTTEASFNQVKVNAKAEKIDFTCVFNDINKVVSNLNSINTKAQNLYEEYQKGLFAQVNS